jgi:DNA helicase IV
LTEFTEQLASEQQAVDVIFARFDETVQSAWERLRSVRIEDVGSTFAARTERDSFAAFYEDTIDHLRRNENKLIFGKVGYDAEKDFASYYIGRIGVQSEEHEPLLIDWRSSIGGDFYGATNQAPNHVQLRRHILLKDRAVVGIEDEVLQYNADAKDTHVIGEGALLAAMQAVRTSYMQDIVATIQREQDSIIRAKMPGALVIQGGPGTGKTAVALHRIAYLLYQNRDTLSQDDILFLGPSKAFLTYVHRVLPSLGEVGVRMLRLADFWPDVAFEREATPLEQEVKGDSRMSDVIKRAVSGYTTRLNEDVDIFVSGSKVVVRKALVQEVMSSAKRLHKQYNPGRRYFVKEILKRLVDEWVESQREDVLESDIDFMRDDIETHPKIRQLLGVLWMPIDAPTLVKRLFMNLKRFEHAFAKYFDSQTVYDLQCELSAFIDVKAKEYQFSEADVALVDEAYALLGDVGARQKTKHSEKDLQFISDVLEGVASEAKGIVSKEMLTKRILGEESSEDLRERRFRHIVIDEAQELSYMDMRMVTRKSSTGSYTLVGDIFQTGSRAGVHDWEDLRKLLADVSVQELTINYRNPREIAEIAQKYAHERGFLVPETKAPRQKADSVHIIRQDNTADGFANALEDVLHSLPDGESIAIIAPTKSLEGAKASLGEIAQEKNVQFFTPRAAKGLEFEHVLLFHLDDMSAPDLFVAMTRATSTLVMVEAAA